jgi:hypothetical protein
LADIRRDFLSSGLLIIGGASLIRSSIQGACSF